MTETHSAANAPLSAGDRGRQALREVEDSLRGLQYGTVTIIVQDGVVVQVERTEKVRIDRK